MVVWISGGCREVGLDKPGQNCIIVPVFERPQTVLRCSRKIRPAMFYWADEISRENGMRTWIVVAVLALVCSWGVAQIGPRM
jgi:hypothetical protein